MVYPICVGCGGQIRQGRKFKIREGLQKIFWSARLLRHVDSNDCICQPCRFKFVAWKKETRVDFVHLINQEEEKTEDEVDNNSDDDVCSFLNVYIYIYIYILIKSDSI
mgnify:CR=1 FL=1